MKKGMIIIMIMLSGVTMAQDFVKGGNYITLGYGFDPFYRPYHSYGIGPVIFGYERGVTDVLGIGRIGAGGTVGTTFYPGYYVNGKKKTGVQVSIVGRATYHFEFNVPKMDVYAGLQAGVNISNVRNYNAANPYLETGAYPTGGAFAGIRYYFTDAFGVYAEAGYGLGALNGGMVFAF